MSQNKLKAIKGARPSAFMVTANDLQSGDVVYLGARDRWLLTPLHGLVFATQEQAQSKADACNQGAAHLIVGAYIIALGKDGLPVSTKEQIRSQGPTNYAHGKQQDMPEAQRIMSQK